MDVSHLSNFVSKDPCFKNIVKFMFTTNKRVYEERGEDPNSGNLREVKPFCSDVNGIPQGVSQAFLLVKFMFTNIMSI